MFRIFNNTKYKTEHGYDPLSIELSCLVECEVKSMIDYETESGNELAGQASCRTMKMACDSCWRNKSRESDQGKSEGKTEEDGLSLDFEETEEVKEPEVLELKQKWYAVVCASEKERLLLSFWLHWPDTVYLHYMMDCLSARGAHVSGEANTFKFRNMIHDYLRRREQDGVSILLTDSAESAKSLGFEVMFDINDIPGVIESNISKEEEDVLVGDRVKSLVRSKAMIWIHRVEELSGSEGTSVVSFVEYGKLMKTEDDAESFYNTLTHIELCLRVGGDHRLLRQSWMDGNTVTGEGIPKLIVAFSDLYNKIANGKCCCSLFSWFKLEVAGSTDNIFYKDEKCLRRVIIKFEVCRRLLIMTCEPCADCLNKIRIMSLMSWEHSKKKSTSGPHLKIEVRCKHEMWGKVLLYIYSDLSESKRKSQLHQKLLVNEGICTLCEGRATDVKEQFRMIKEKNSCCFILRRIRIGMVGGETRMLPRDSKTGEKISENIIEDMITISANGGACDNCSLKLSVLGVLMKGEDRTAASLVKKEGDGALENEGAPET